VPAGQATGQLAKSFRVLQVATKNTNWLFVEFPILSAAFENLIN